MPMSVAKQVAIIYCGTTGLLKNIPVEKIKAFENDFLQMLELKYADVVNQIDQGSWNDEITNVLEQLASEVSASYLIEN